MKIKVVLSRETLDLLWALGGPKPRENETPLRPDEAVVEVDEEIVSNAIDLFDDETFDHALRRLAHVRLTQPEESP